VAPSPELIKKMNDVLETFGQGNYDDALTKLNDVDKLRPNDPELINLRGAIYVKAEKWPQANDAFNHALQINPKYFPARFNLTEVAYLQKKYPEARAGLEKLLTEDPRNELIQYKIYLTYLLEGNLTEAKARLDKFDFTGNTPAYYYAQAAWSYNQKNVPEAESYIASAVQIFPPQSNNLFAESLIDAGWLKRKTAPTPPAK
jgi:tetratricopeptide (TPR) repeat protein